MKRTAYSRFLARAAVTLLAVFSFSGAKAQDYFYEGFEGGAMPEGWTTDGPGTWSVGTGDYSASTGAGAGTYNAKITHGTTGNVTKLITPAIDLSAATTAQLSFMHIQRSWAGDIDKLKVYYRTSSEGEWVQLAEYTDAYASWKLEGDNGEIILPNLSSTYQIAFEMTDAYGYGVGIDEVTIFEGTSCSKPTAFAVSEIGPRSAVLSWTPGSEDQDAWQICINGDEENLIDVTENPYTLTGLTPETDYTVKVRGNCGEEKSKWSAAISFTTLVAAPVPTELAASRITAYSATLNWEGYANEYNVRYAPEVHGEELAAINFDNSSMGAWTTIDADGDGYTWVLGSECGGIYLVEGGSLAGTGHNASQDLVTSGSYSNATGGALTPDNYLVSPKVTLGGSITFWACAQDGSYPAEHFGVAVSTTGNTDAADFTTIQEWDMTAKAAGANAKAGTTRSGNRDQGTWYEFTVDLSAYSGEGYVAIRHFDCTDQFMLNIDDIVIESAAADIQWTEFTVSGNSADIDGLEPETKYIWQVQGNFGEDGMSNWANSSFTTKSPFDEPSDLAATEISATKAILTWAGSQDSYNVQYRTAEVNNEYYFTNFNTDADRDGWSWDGNVIYGFSDPIYGYSDDENYFLQMGWNTTEEATIVSPELPDYESGSVLEFYYSGYTNTNTFQVGYSSTTNDLESFEWSDPIDAPLMEYTKFSEELSDGIKYVAFKATASAQSASVFIDNFRVYKLISPAGEWVSATTTEPTLTISGLTPETKYDWQVQGIYADEAKGTTEWVDGPYFTTQVLNTIALADDDSEATQKNSEIITAYDGKACDVTLTGRTLYKDGLWNTICLPFDVTIEDSPLAGATAKTLSSASTSTSALYGTHIDLAFGEAVSKLEAGKPYIIKWDAAENIVAPVFEDVLIKDVPESDRTISMDNDNVKFIGYYDAFGIDETNEDIFYMKTGKDDNNNDITKLVRTANNRTLRTCRAYFEFSKEAAKLMFALNGDDEATGIVDLDREATTNSGWYTVDGKKLDKQPTRKGVYIQNGRAVVIK